MASLTSVSDTLLALVLLLLTFLFVRKLLFFLTWHSFRDGPYVIGQHQWRPGNLAGPQWCNVCQATVYGIRSYVVMCDICGMFAHAQCAASMMPSSLPTAAPLSLRTESCACKAPGVAIGHGATMDSTEPATRAQQHVWIKGNIDPMDSCALCGLFCGSLLALSGLKCAWCHVRVHEKCFHQALARPHRPPLLRRCGFGRHAKLIVPPSCVQLRERGSTSQRALKSMRSAAQLAVTTMSNLRRRPNASIRDQIADSAHVAASNAVEACDGLPYHLKETPKDSTPLLVFVNGRSGGQMGLHLLRQVRKWLNPIQIYDLSHQSPMEPLRQFIELPRLRLLVCGGDGTVGWILSALDELGAPRQPPIAVLPLGTGNDLARVLGWGAGFSAFTDLSDILSEVEAAHVSLLDRWEVQIGSSPKKRVVLNNYMGVGVDAQVALEFHEQRERSPGLFMSQFVNKLWYSQFGAKNFLVRTCAGLAEKIRLECDGKRIALPPGTEGVILLNINSYGGGAKLWHENSDAESDEAESLSETEEEEDQSETSSSGSRDTRPHFGPSSPFDGLLDVVAVYGTLHLGQMQVGMSKAVRLCQAKSVRLVLKETLPVQIDGEPWLQPANEMRISMWKHAFMLSRTVDERDVVTKKVGEVLDWAEQTHLVTSQQRDVLLAEISRRVANSTLTRTACGTRAHRPSE
ncbi:hypothetical protein PsorP6_004943 [Peronosclerospora sorghi]|uniref:Uncharacterized protein n=1 Tax=Peronosclerospora sorghi TaxID=230839 RepID=A0ACC0W7T7_9STRA|nr:hypothetical protein PsorP6_004943 [Peronosclerospora sorghi]